MMGITKMSTKHEMSIYELFHYSLFPGLFIAFTYNKKQPPAFGAAPAFWCILLCLIGLLFCHISNNLSNYNVLTANAPFFYQISGTWSGLIMKVVFYYGVGSQVFMDSCYRGRSAAIMRMSRGGLHMVFKAADRKKGVKSAAT